MNAKNADGVAPLHAALAIGPTRPAKRSEARIVMILLNAGAEVNSQANSGETALLGAALSGEIEVVSILLEAGADVNARSTDWGTPLDAAVSMRDSLMESEELRQFLHDRYEPVISALRAAGEEPRP